MQKAHGDNISVDRAGIYYINVPFREKLDMLITLGVLQPHEDNNLSQKKGKSPISPSKYRKSPIFNIQLRNQITEAIQLFKPDKFSPLGGFEGSFPFCEN